MSSVAKHPDSRDGGGKSVSKHRSAASQAQGTAARTLERIEALGLTPVPHFYELWFRYYQGDPEIVRALDHAPGPIDEALCHKLCKQYLSDGARDEAVRKIGDQIQQAVAGMVSMLTSAKTATSEYGDHLSGMAERIRKAESLEDLGQVVSAIVEDTRRMLEKNQELELQLVSSSQQVSELRKNLDNVKKEAVTDGLTDLINRKAFDKQIRDCVEEASVTGAPLVLLMLDIDHFKSFNDNFGHQTGDQVLRLVARILNESVKGRDVAARFGGEEFAIILPETPLRAGLRVAEILRKSVEGKEVVNRSSHKHLGQITLSIGVAEYRPGESITDFIGRADDALYEAKDSGRNRVAAARPPS